MMDDPEIFPPLIIYAIPVMLGLVLLEFVLSQIQKRKVYEGKDLLASIFIGIGNLITTAFLNIAMFSIILFFYNVVPWTVPITWWSFILCLVILDFFRYWAHRIAHEQRFWWATHVTHHSSENYNFSVSFRLSWVQQIKLVFFIPVALCGFHPVVFFICHQIEVLYQFWIHTEFIRKLPRPIEFIFTTPSHHRVHHATNEKYLDKNYGSTFIIWDRMFGTFQPEEEQAIYGITKPPESYNPAYLVFHEFMDIVKDFFHASDWKTRWKILFGHPGWYTARDEELKKAASEGLSGPKKAA
ncbi:MAG: sterol desaturase family protein [Bacteroidota bacterium]